MMEQLVMGFVSVENRTERRRIRARRSDPVTSQEAAAAAEKSGRITKQRAIVLAAYVEYGKCSTGVLSERARIDRHMVGRRAPELVDSGYLRLLKERDERGFMLEPVVKQSG